MITQHTDTASAVTSVSGQGEGSAGVTTVHRKGWHSPHEILSWLPADATPWQQDSAIRANTVFDQVDWSKRPNPMRTPTTRADAPSGFRLDKPMYYSRSLVQPDSVYRPEYATYQQGVAGDPVPYTIAGDNLITSLLLACFVLGTLAIAKSGHFIGRQFKNFFRTPHEGTTEVTETGGELWFQLFLVAQTCLLSAILFFFWHLTSFNETFIVPHYQIIGIYTASFVVYFLVKALLYGSVNWVFFDKKKNEQWMKSGLFLVSIEGIALFPIVMLMVYFDLSVESTAVYAAIVVILVKLLTFYKTHLIFFRRNSAVLQNILYFCALEMMPLSALWGVLVLTDKLLKLNF